VPPPASAASAAPGGAGDASGSATAGPAGLEAGVAPSSKEVAGGAFSYVLRDLVVCVLRWRPLAQRAPDGRLAAGAACQAAAEQLLRYLVSVSAGPSNDVLRVGARWRRCCHTARPPLMTCPGPGVHAAQHEKFKLNFRLNFCGPQMNADYIKAMLMVWGAAVPLTGECGAWAIARAQWSAAHQAST